MYLWHYLSLQNLTDIYFPTPKSKSFDWVHPGIAYLMIQNSLLSKDDGIKEIRRQQDAYFSCKNRYFRKTKCLNGHIKGSIETNLALSLRIFKPILLSIELHWQDQVILQYSLFNLTNKFFSKYELFHLHVRL